MDQTTEQNLEWADSGAYQKLNNFILGIRKMQDAKLDNLIFISGPKGVGKTSASVQISRRYVATFFNEQTFDCEKYIAYNNRDVRKLVKDLPEYSPIVCDEAARFAMAWDWNSYESKQLAEFFTQIRTKKLTVFFNIPKMQWLNDKYKKIATWWIKIYQRGTAVIFRPDLSECDDPFHIKELKELERHYFFTSNMDVVINRIRKHPCFFDVISIPQMPAPLETKYLELRNRKVFETDILDENMDQKELAKIMVYNLRTNVDAIVANIAQSSSRLNKRPGESSMTFTLMEKLITANPYDTSKSLASHEACRNWFHEIAELVKKSKLG
jgi:hypothetical protein